MGGQRKHDERANARREGLNNTSMTRTQMYKAMRERYVKKSDANSAAKKNAGEKRDSQLRSVHSQIRRHDINNAVRRIRRAQGLSAG